jgi:hypothetical protein
MALTVDITYRDRDGQMLRTFADVTFDSSLAAGGESLTPAMLGFGRFIRELRISGDHAGYVVQYDYANEKLTAYRQSAATGALDEADTIDLSSGVEVKVVAIGY